MRKTKIVATLGPATEDRATLERLIGAGMDVARFNFSHGTHEEHLKRLQNLKKAREALGRPVAALLDTKGHEVRLQNFKGGKAYLQRGGRFVLCSEPILGDETCASLSYDRLWQDVKPGNSILLNDGNIELRVLEVQDGKIVTEVKNGGVISDKKGVNTPGVHLQLPSMSEADKADILFGIEQGFDLIAASFMENKESVLELKQFLRDNGGGHIKVISKIESESGLENAEEIIAVSDGVMVARGDMGVEVPLEEVPVMQKRLIKLARKRGVQVIIATQMLESMINNPRPTRAESTDVANAIYDGTSAVMLSGETAMGSYPVEAVAIMAAIAARTEKDIDYKKRFRENAGFAGTLPNAISHAACTIAHDLDAAAIFAMTKSGYTADMVSKFRPAVPILGCAVEDYVLRQMNACWGVAPMKISEQTDADEMFCEATNEALKKGFIQSGDFVVITAGVPLGISGLTNLLKVEKVK